MYYYWDGVCIFLLHSHGVGNHGLVGGLLLRWLFAFSGSRFLKTSTGDIFQDDFFASSDETWLGEQLFGGNNFGSGCLGIMPPLQFRFLSLD